MSQQQDILHALKYWETMCGTEFLDMHIPRYAARIHELRNKGYWISSERCKEHNYHKTAQTLYRLIEEPE